MADNPDKDSESDPGVIDVERLGRLADCLLILGRSFAEMTKFLKENGVKSIQGKGMPTAERGLGYLANFTSNVTGGYQEARLDGHLSVDAPLKTQGQLVTGAAMAKNLARKKKVGTKDGTRKS